MRAELVRILEKFSPPGCNCYCTPYLGTRSSCRWEKRRRWSFPFGAGRDGQATALRGAPLACSMGNTGGLVAILVVLVAVAGIFQIMPVGVAGPAPTSGWIKAFSRDTGAGFQVLSSRSNVTGVTAFLVVPTVVCSPTRAASQFEVAEWWAFPESAALTISCSNSTVRYGTQWVDVLTNATGAAQFTPRPGDRLFLSLMKQGTRMVFELVDFTQNLSTRISEPLNQRPFTAPLDYAFCGSYTVLNSTGSPLPEVPFHLAHFYSCAFKVGGRLQGVGYAPLGTHDTRVVDENSTGTGVIEAPSVPLAGLPGFNIWLKSPGP